jgi:hypothetical protein
MDHLALRSALRSTRTKFPLASLRRNSLDREIDEPSPGDLLAVNVGGGLRRDRATIPREMPGTALDHWQFTGMAAQLPERLLSLNHRIACSWRGR